MGIGPIFAIPDLLAKTGNTLQIQAKKYRTLIFGNLTRPSPARQFTALKN
jgi:hypothetical protein